MNYYGFVPKGRKMAEVFVSKDKGSRSSQVETGVTYPSFRAAESAVATKNLIIANARILA